MVVKRYLIYQQLSKAYSQEQFLMVIYDVLNFMCIILI